MRVSARMLVAVVLASSLALLTGCSASNGTTWRDPGSTSGQPQSTSNAANEARGPAVTAPSDGATNVPTSTELTLDGALDPSTEVKLTDAAGTVVTGAVHPDGKTWLPATQLKYGTAYTVSVTAPGKPEKKSTFTTMAKPGKLINVSVPIDDNQTYGVGLPIVVRFGSTIPAASRAAVERRLIVTSTPAQVGSWYWFGGGEVHFRPKDYWQTGTKISVRLATGGLSFGSSMYGAKDVTLNLTIGDKIVMETNDATHTMTVTKNGNQIKSIPVSLGKASTPSSSGNMVVMTKSHSELFVSTDPSDPYRETVYYTQRLTNGGEYIHAAPWSEGSQGHRNVSHGCTNVSQANAIYLYGFTRVGDVVIVKGTSRKLAWGNGWTDWDKSWEEYLKGSATGGPAPTANPSGSTSPAASPSTSPSN